MKNYLILIIFAQTIAIIFLASFMAPSIITSNIGDHATWSGSIISFFTMITTSIIGFYAYNIAKDQNKTSQISYMTEMLCSLAKQCNEAAKLANHKMENKAAQLEYPNIEKCLSNIPTAIIKASEIINHLHPDDFVLYKTMFYSMIDSAVSTEIIQKNILNEHKPAMMENISRSYDEAKCMIEPPQN